MPELKLENSLVDERYEVRERLGLGSYAEIFVARDHEAGRREVVIKALNTSLQGTPDVELERTLVENFQNEAMALDLVRHPHVILRLGHGTAADLRNVPFHYLVLEYMSGGDLLRLCREQRGNALRLNYALLYFRQICEALAYAHSQGVIHRDLKPNNFLLSASRQKVKIADFGVAKFTSHETTEITRVGTGIYAPPEHHPDDAGGSFGKLTAAADIYSLAKSFYTVVCGRAPNEFYRKQITSLPHPCNSQPWAEALLKVLCRATADRVDARYASVTEFWSDLADVATLAEDADEVETQVRPRLHVAPGNLPEAPVTPEFEPTLASSGSNAVISVTPAVSTGQSRAAEAPPIKRGRGIVVDLRPAPRVQPTPPVAQPLAANGDQAPTLPLDDVIDDWRESSSHRSVLKAGALAVLCLLALLTAMYGVYRFATHTAAPQVEILTENLNVRTGPGVEYPVIGAVARGTHHRILSHAANGWYQIEVSKWSDVIQRTSDQNQGWVRDSPETLKAP
ncbi:MAG TPA: serine/threonine protein kinase [Blastocatellia bacterium]|nr:serine/threonine protein kinase [Blastocatellia bacterium]